MQGKRVRAVFAIQRAGAAENPVWRCGVLSLLSRGGETRVVASGSAPRYRGIKGHTAESRVQIGWYRGYITAVPWNAPWGGFFRPTNQSSGRIL